MMSNYRKRRSSESIESDRKRFSYERYDCDSYIKQEYNPHVNNNGRLNHIGSPRNITPDSKQYAKYYESQRYYNQYVEPQKYTAKRSVIGYNTSCYNDVLAMYDRRQMNFKYEVYLNSLRQCEPRYVNFHDLKRHLSDIDVRCLCNWNFTTAFDLAQELESSLKYFIDTRNEIIFLRKLHRQQYIPFSYNNDIHITNTSRLYDRMKFLENESAYRSNRMNQLFYQLQNVVVIPSLIDDIRYVHSTSYDKSWNNRARYWFNQFKQIKWQKGFRPNFISTKNRFNKYQQSFSKYSGKNLYQSETYCNRANIKSEVVITSKVSPSLYSKSVKIEKVESNGSNAYRIKQSSNIQSVKSIQTVSNTVLEPIESGDKNNNLLLPKNVEVKPLEAVESADKAQAKDKIENESESELTKSFTIVEPNISVVTVTDEDNLDASNNVDPPEGDINK